VYALPPYTHVWIDYW